MPTKKYSVVIIGGGTAGITIAARLRKKRPLLDVALIEPATKHYYQPLWTLVGGGMFSKEESEKNEKDLIPTGVDWIQQAVSNLDPAQNALTLANGDVLRYKQLVVTAGLKIEWSKVEGLEENLSKNGVCSIYSFDTVENAWNTIRDFKGGEAIFTHPSTPIKCGGAPQKICYLADEQFRMNGVREKTNLHFMSAQAKIFSVDKYAKSLLNVIKRKEIDAHLRHNLVRINGAKKEAVFANLDTGNELKMSFDLLHVTPPMGPPDFVKNSSLADNDGWVDVDKNTLQHKRFSNVFSAGDVANLPTSKTGAAIRKQAPVLVENLVSQLESLPLRSHYDGYTSCPLVTGYKSLILAEFDYDLSPTESFPFDQSEERYSMLLLKKYGLPNFYWNVMLKGRG